MGRKLIDRAGQRFNRLLVLSVNRVDGVTMATCECDCGTIVNVQMAGVVNGTTKACGCYRREYMSRTRTKHGEGDNGRETPEYKAWRGMINRCYNGDEAHRRIYTDRGIKVCEKWRHDYLAFLADVGRKPSHEYSLDRYPNNDGDYEPGNVRWATRSEQAKNRRERPRDENGSCWIGGAL